jgi:hypothetical protein
MKRDRSGSATGPGALLHAVSGCAEVVETNGPSGRAVLAVQHLRKGDIVCVTDSYAISSVDTYAGPSGCCRNCGDSITVDATAPASDDCTERERVCCNICGYARLTDPLIGESQFLRHWPEITSSASEDEREEDLSAQALLAYRVLMHRYYYKEDAAEAAASGDPFALVGDESDCDEARLAMAEHLVAVAARCAAAGHPSGALLTNRLTGENVMTILGIIHRNAFKVREGVIALLPGAAMFNHSCGPNAVMTVEYVTKTPCAEAVAAAVTEQPFRCLRATIRCVADVAPGQEVCISYVPLGLHPREARQQAVSLRHDFVCNCAVCSTGQGQEQLSQQGVTAVGDIEVTTEPLVEMLEEAEELLQDLTTCDLEDVSFLLTQAESSVNNLQLGPLHYLSMKRLALLAEVNQADKQFEDVVTYTTEWLARLDSEIGATIALICDPHYRCRMHVLCAEASGECYKEATAAAVDGVSDDTYTLSVTKKTFLDAIEQAAAIYGEDYALVTNLRRQLSELQQS